MNGLSSEARDPMLLSFMGLVDSDIIHLLPPDTARLIEAGKIADTDTRSQRHISSYDAIFHALALQMNAVFITADKSHYRKTKDTVGSVALLEDLEI